MAHLHAVLDAPHLALTDEHERRAGGALLEGSARVREGLAREGRGGGGAGGGGGGGLGGGREGAGGIKHLLEDELPAREVGWLEGLEHDLAVHRGEGAEQRRLEG